MEEFIAATGKNRYFSASAGISKGCGRFISYYEGRQGAAVSAGGRVVQPVG